VARSLAGLTGQKNETDAMIMTFGKHRGKRLENIPKDYLLWVLDNCSPQPTLLRAIKQVLGLSDEPTTAISTDIVGPWYRKLAMEFHPDQGGTHQAMKVVNRCSELLAEMMEGAA